jgi:PIN domain nuclease of toxin-antitoxin system
VRLLLDTHVFLWWSDDDRRLRSGVRDVILAADRICVSVASAWEVAIKSALGKLAVGVPFEQAIDINGFDKLVIDFRHAAAVTELPPHHGDPFDRMLIAQARVEGLTLVTHDRKFEPYPVHVLWT